jgi:hypothetical protein
VEVDLSWRDGAFQEATLRSALGQPLRVRLGDRVVPFASRAGESLTLGPALERRP